MMRREKVSDLDNYRNIYIYGSGELGIFVKKFSEAQNIHIRGFIDKNDKKEIADGMPVFSLTNFSKDDTLVVEGIYNPSNIDRSIFDDCAVISTKDYLMLASNGTFRNFCSLANPSIFESEKANLDGLISIFHDDKSKEQLKNLIKYQLGLIDTSYSHEKLDRLYFDPEIMDVSTETIFMDCGAYDGDTILKARDFYQSNLKAVVAFEPSSSFVNSTIQEFCDGNNIVLHYYACGLDRISHFQKFSALGLVSDSLSVQSKYNFWFSRIDDIELPVKPNFVKFDIEGSELNALEGGLDFFNTCRPTIAISLYHRPLDFYNIPMFLSSRLDNYKYIFRQYADNCWETVLYAVPDEIVV